jgi:hypothetical protein
VDIVPAGCFAKDHVFVFMWLELAAADGTVVFDWLTIAIGTRNRSGGWTRRWDWRSVLEYFNQLGGHKSKLVDQVLRRLENVVKNVDDVLAW